MWIPFVESNFRNEKGTAALRIHVQRTNKLKTHYTYNKGWQTEQERGIIFRRLETNSEDTYYSNKTISQMYTRTCAPSFHFSHSFAPFQFTPIVYVMLHMTLKWNVRQPPKFSTKFLCWCIRFSIPFCFLEALRTNIDFEFD